LHNFILLLFEKYAMLLEKQFSRRFDEVSGHCNHYRTKANHLSLEIVLQDDHVPMRAETANDRDAVLEVVWLGNSEQTEIVAYVVVLYPVAAWLIILIGTLCRSTCHGRKHSTYAVRMCVGC
jgi:hypothetical protein